MDILIPWRDTDPHRAANFDRLCAHYAPYGRIITGDSDPALEFNCSIARNVAAAASGDDVLVFVDADAILDPTALVAAVKDARRSGGLVRPFRQAAFVTEAATKRFLAGGPLRPDFIYPPTRGFIGLAWVVHRDAFERLGGFDPAFVGYGGEDNAFSASCEKLFGRITDRPGTCSSLWHPAHRVAEPEIVERVQRYYAIQTWDDYFALRTDLER